MAYNNSSKASSIVIGNWELKKCIGKGSFSEIYVGRDISENSAASKDNNSTNGISSDGNSNSNSGNTDFVAIKLQHQDVDPTVIRWESEVLQILAGESVVPKFVTNGKDENREYLVMEYLNGEDMAAIRNKIRTNNPTGLIPLTISVYLTKQMLSCVECLHKHGVLHRDIKPSNFVRKSRNSSQFSVIDFGIAKLYKDRDGVLKPMKEKADFRGTTQYASPYTHEGRDQCPRDDLYSVIYTFVDFFCGKLPWTDASRQRNKAVVADLKFKYRENSDEFITWMQETISAAVADCSLLLSTTIPTIPLQPYLPTAVSSSDAATKLYSLFPVTVQKNLKQILDYIKTLNYEDSPDYQLIHRLLSDCVPQEALDAISSIDFAIPDIFAWQNKYAWVADTRTPSGVSAAQIGSEKFMRVRRLTETEQIEIKRSVSGYGGVVYPAAMSSQYGLGTAQTGINSAAPNGQNSVDSSSVPTARNRYVYDQLKEMYTSIDQGNADIALKKSMVPRWTYLVGDVLLKLPENAIDYETIHLCYKFLARMDNFYDLRWAANSTSYTAMSVWTEFTRLQETIFQFYELFSRITALKRSEKSKLLCNGSQDHQFSGTVVHNDDISEESATKKSRTV